MSSDAPWTIKRLLEWTAEFLGRHGSSSPRLDAEVLLSHCCDCQRIDLYARFDQVPTGTPLEQFRSMVKERASGAPVAYLVGHREFYSMSFQVNSDVLIPRPETEFLVIEALDAAKTMQDAGQKELTIVDVGTGSGCIAIALAKHLPNAQLIGIDISEAALDVARLNADRHAVNDRAQWRRGDVLEDFDRSVHPHIIVSNPPYIGKSEQNTLMRDVVEFEPKLALFAGEDGMDVIHRLVKQAGEVLAPGGLLLMEISPLIESKVTKLLTDSSEFDFLGMRLDLDNHPRVAKARRLERSSDSGDDESSPTR